MFTRICPSCGKIIHYKYESTRNNAEKNKSLCRNCATYKNGSKERLGDLSVLLNDTPEAFYWIGFIMADGSFQNNRLCIGISAKDILHLQKFANFINFTGLIEKTPVKLGDKIFYSCGLSVQDSRIVPKIKEKFDLKNNKTKNPPKTILKWNKTLLLSMFAGYVDGDGSIIKKTNRKDAKLCIQVHNSWLHILNEFNSIVSDKNFCYINSNGYAVMGIETFPIIRKLKEFLLTLNIPLLERKWDRIDISYINKLEKTQIILEKIQNDYNNGIRRKDICKKYSVSNAFLTKHLIK